MKYIKILRELSRLKKNANRTADQMKELQNQKLRAMLHYAWEHSAFYRNSFEAGGFAGI